MGLTEQDLLENIEKHFTATLPEPWNSRLMPLEDVSSTCPPVPRQERKGFSVPSVCKVADDDIRTLVSEHFGLPLYDTLYAVDMELLHVHRKMEYMLLSRKNAVAPRVLQNGCMEWRFWAQKHPGWDIRRDDFILYKIAISCVSGGPWTTKDLMTFYMDRFSIHRFEEDGIVPYPAGVQPEKYRDLLRKRTIRTDVHRTQAEVHRLLAHECVLEEKRIYFFEDNWVLSQEEASASYRCNTLPNAIDRFQAMTPREQKDHLEYLHQRFDEPDPLSDLTHKLSAVGMAGDITLGPIIQPEELSRRQAKPTHTRGGKEKPRRSPAEGMSGTETVGQSSSMEGHSAAPEFEDKMEID